MMFETFCCGCKDCSCRAKVKEEDSTCGACKQGLHDKFKKK